MSRRGTPRPVVRPDDKRLTRQAAPPPLGSSQGRPPQTATLRLGKRVIVQRVHGGPLEGATVTAILSGRPRVVVLVLDAGGEIRITV